MFDNRPSKEIKSTTPQTQPARPDDSGAQASSDHELALDLISEYSPDASSLSFGHIRARILAHISTIRAHTPDLEDVRGMRILDVACGSRMYPDNNFGAHDPWMPRLLLELGAVPVGLDLADQVGERFEFHKVDLLVRDSLSFLTSGAFDSYHVRSFPTRKVAIAIGESGLSWPVVRANLLEHLTRALKPGCTPMRSFQEITDRYVCGSARAPTGAQECEGPSLRLEC